MKLLIENKTEISLFPSISVCRAVESICPFQIYLFLFVSDVNISDYQNFNNGQRPPDTKCSF